MWMMMIIITCFITIMIITIMMLMMLVSEGFRKNCVCLSAAIRGNGVQPTVAVPTVGGKRV